MARNANLSAVESEATEEAPYGYKSDGTPRKRAASTGPRTRTNKPYHVLFRATDENGNPVPGAKLEVVYIGKDPAEVLKLHRSQRDLEYTTINTSGEVEAE